MVHVRVQHGQGTAAARRLGRSARRFLRELGRPRGELSILLAGDSALRRLNRSWRGVDAATDVLSFPAAPAPEGRLLGDLAISLDTALRRSRAEGRSVGAELDRYLAHGLLHLLGEDHLTPGQARRMAERERRLLSSPGMVDRPPGRPRRRGPRVATGRAARRRRGT
jgi:probable rRNA maturation factor